MIKKVCFGTDLPLLSVVASAFEGRWSMTFVALATLASPFVVASIFMGEAFVTDERV
jgi:hypothetical protein